MIDPSHIVAGVIGAMTLATAVLIAGAFFSMGRSGYRKD